MMDAAVVLITVIISLVAMAIAQAIVLYSKLGKWENEIVFGTFAVFMLFASPFVAALIF